MVLRATCDVRRATCDVRVPPSDTRGGTTSGPRRNAARPLRQFENRNAGGPIRAGPPSPRLRRGLAVARAPRIASGGGRGFATAAAANPDADPDSYKRPANPSRRGHREARAGGAIFRPSGRGAAELMWCLRAPRSACAQVPRGTIVVEPQPMNCRQPVRPATPRPNRPQRIAVTRRRHIRPAAPRATRGKTTLRRLPHDGGSGLGISQGGLESVGQRGNPRA